MLWSARFNQNVLAGKLNEFADPGKDSFATLWILKFAVGDLRQVDMSWIAWNNRVRPHFHPDRTNCLVQHRADTAILSKFIVRVSASSFKLPFIKKVRESSRPSPR